MDEVSQAIIILARGMQSQVILSYFKLQKQNITI